MNIFTVLEDWETQLTLYTIEKETTILRGIPVSIRGSTTLGNTRGG